MPARFKRLRSLLAAFALALTLSVLWVFLDLPPQEDGSRPADRKDRAVATVTTAATAPRTVEVRKENPAAAAPQEADAIAAFRTWTQAFLKADAEARAALLPEGLRLAAARRPVFRQVIRSDPRRALDEAVPMVVRQALPPEIVSLLEERVNDRGMLRVMFSSPPDPGTQPQVPAVLRSVELENGSWYEAHVFGRRSAETKWVSDASLNGVALDGDLALNESPVRALEIGEVPDPAKKQVTVCPVSGLQSAADQQQDAPVTAETPAVEAYGEIVYLCNGSHLVLYEQSLIYAENSSGGAQGFTGILPASPTPSVGMVKVLYIPVIFPDQGTVPASEQTLRDSMRQAGEFYQTMSYGRLTLVATVTPPVTMPRNQAWYAGKDTTVGYIKEIAGLTQEMAHAKEQARKLGYDSVDYDCVCIREAGGASYATSFGGGGNVWMRSDSVSTISHEVGHAFGLAHANFWLTNGASVIGPGGNEEYGDSYDNMGTGSPSASHYNVQAKNQVKWLPDEFVPPITTSGSYRIHAYDTAKLEPGKRYGLRIQKDQDRTYWGEHRTLFPSNVWVTNGLLLGWKWPLNSASNLQLLDTTPGSINAKSDAPISLGRTFSDTEAGIHITTTAVNASTSPPSVDVQVNFGQFPTNQPPMLALTPGTVVVPTSTNVTFTATASDPDGDAVSYAWIWQDGVVSPNAATATRSFSTAGIYTLSCVVSDMKGGIAIRNAVITVGNGGSRFTIAGRITRNGGGLPGINVSASGSNGTLTDTDGYYVIPNLTAGTYTVTPAAHGYAFNELFNNSLTVGPSFSGADFTVDDLPLVTITSGGTNAVENSATGTFTLTRTGSTALPLTVNVFPVQGTATKGTDYTFSPDYTILSSTPYYTFVIPADQASLTVTLTTVNDASQEGHETATLVLGLDAAYLVGAANTATVGIDDDDTARPRVSLTAAPAQVIEGGGLPVVVTATRTGSTAASLDVTYTVATTSTATAGADYTALSGTVTIPAGQSSATFDITPMADAVSEDTESVTVSIATGASFMANTAANTIVARIVDDDTQVVSLAVMDSAATEVDRTLVGAVPNPGTLLITRSGDTGAALTVHYGVSGTALHGADYEPLSGSVTFATGQTQVPVTIMPRFDSFGEPSETVIVNLAAGKGNYLLGSTSGGTVTIADSGAVPYLEVVALTGLAAEPSTNGNFRITAKSTTTGTLTVDYTISGTATAGTDYTMSGLNTTTLTGSTTITLTGGVVTKDIAVTTVNDALLEEMETVTMTLTPGASYTLWDQASSSTVILRDDDQPTVYVDGQVATGGADTVAESSTGTTLKFYISRTGSTTSALTVNYSMAGTATNGTDHSSLSGTATIPAGAPGVDVSFNTIADTAFEGTETVVLHLESGSYARGPDAKLYITDDDAGSQSVAFTNPGASGAESATSVSIPVSLNAPATSPVTVEYAIESGTRLPTVLSGQWLRIVRTGTSFESYSSPDGATWTKQSSTRTISMASASYLVGIVLASGSSGTAATAMVDNVSVTGVSAGGSVSAAITSADIGSLSPPGTNQESSGLHKISSGGPDIATAGTTDAFRCLYFTVSNATDCTISARVLGITCTGTAAKAGVMMRETTANNARHFSCITDSSGTNAARQIYRTTAAGTSSSAVISAPTFAKPRWLRLSRVGDVFTAYTSADGSTFSPIGGGQTMAMGTQSLIGLAVSARSDGLLTTATFDNVSINPAPAAALQGRTVGFVNEQGRESESGGTWTVIGSGAGIMTSNTSTEDECHFLSTPATGDFTLTARLAGLSGGASTAQAGLMVRESVNHRARTVWFGLTGSGTTAAEFKTRFSATTFGEGAGVDYSLPPGVLSYSIGEQSKDIVLNVTNDAAQEPVEFLNVILKNPGNAVLGTPSLFTYSIVDDDEPVTLPSLGFAGASSAGAENVTPVSIPVVLSAPSGSTVTVDYTTTLTGTATSGADFTAISGTLTFAAGEMLQNIALPLLDDSGVESAETVVLTLSNASGGALSSTATHTFTITDDDTPAVTIAASDATATEGGDSGAFTFTRSGPTTSSLTVNFTRSGTATSGSDFTAFSPLTSISIPAGQSSVDLVVSPLQNTTPETPETVIVTVASGSGYTIGSPSSATVTINDDDVNTVTLTATDAAASEAGADPGELTLTRSGPTTSALTVTLSVTGTATSGSDFNAVTTSQTFAIGQSSIVIPVAILQDSGTEGSEEIAVSISSSSSYITGTPGVANITITDDDLPPSVYISSPVGKATVVATGNGLLLEATATDDGLPDPVGYTWSKLFGPGAVTFGTGSAATTSATFAAPGVYGLRVTVSDGQFTATDDVFVLAGGFAFADWVSMDQGPPSVRGVSGETNGVFTLIGSGTGYTGTNDSGHMLFRQLLGGTGDCSIIARLSSLSGPGTSLAGLTVRDTSWKGAKRVNLLLDGTGTLQLRSRSTANTADTAGTATGFSSPVWLKLERAGSTVTAFQAPDQSGSPGAFAQVGSPVTVTLGTNVIVGMVVSTGASTTGTATAVFDNVSVTPAPSGSALHSEDIGNYALAGSSSVAGATTTLNAIGTYDGTGGHFRYQQVWGDCIVTARLTSHSGATRGAQSGVGVRDTTDNGPHAFYGMTTTDGFQAHWRSSAGGSGGTLQTGGSVGNWIRLVRKGNNVSAFRATDVSGSPGSWAQVTGNLPAPMTGPVLVGLVVDSNSSSLTATGQFTGLSIEPLNTAPVVDGGTVAAQPPFALNATVTDDGKPNPPGAFTVAWSKFSGPGAVTFADPLVEDTLATLSQSGTYTLRLLADDGDSRTFDDLTFGGYLTPFDAWQAQQFAITGGIGDPNAALTLDPDHDGLSNLLEYALLTDPQSPGADPSVMAMENVSGENYLRLTVPKNPDATDVIYEVQATSDLANEASWSSSGLVIEQNTGTTLQVRDNVPVSAGLRRFMRVLVTR